MRHPATSASAPTIFRPQALELGIDDALLLRLGRVVVLWSYVQMLLGRLLAQLCGAEAGPLLCVAGDLTGEALIVNCARLVQLKLPPEAQPPAQELLADADGLRRTYEMLTRGLWDRGAALGAAVLATPHPARRGMIRHVLIAEAELAETEDHARHMVGELTRLCLQLGVRFVDEPGRVNRRCRLSRFAAAGRRRPTALRGEENGSFFSTRPL